MPVPDNYRAISLLQFNVGAAAAVGFLNPLGAQIDALIALGIGPFQFALGAQFNAALAAQASLSLQIGDPLAAIKAAISAMAQLQAALQAALVIQLPPIALNASFSIAASLALSLKLQLGTLSLLIQAAIAIKIPAIKAAASLAAALNVGPFFAISYGITQPATLAEIGAWFGGQATGPGLTADSHHIAPVEPVFGILIVCRDLSLATQFSAILSVPHL